MRKAYLIAAIVGTIIPNILVAKISVTTGNYLLYWHLPTTLQAMFANEIAAVFIIDLLLVVLLFLLWSFQEARRLHMKEWWIISLFTLLLGMAGGFPLFMYFRERYRTK